MPALTAGMFDASQDMAAKEAAMSPKGESTMPDRRRHRGRHPDDERLFAEAHLPALRSAVADFSWLLTHDYAEVSALKLVGDRYDLTMRQRMAVRRSACSDQSLARRIGNLRPTSDLAKQAVAIDGYNLLITVEAAMSGGLILVGRDGCHRDLASVHGTYRKVSETLPAVRLIAGHPAALAVARVDWYLDAPVSNSGRLRALIEEVTAEAGGDAGLGPRWHVEVTPNPDRALVDYQGLVVTADSVVLDRCGPWVNLAGEIVTIHRPDVWRIDLRY